MSFYDRYVQLCKEKGKTPSGVAVELGMSKAMVSHWKNTRNEPTDITLSKLSDYFGVSIDYLRGNEKSAPAAEGEDAEVIDFANLRNADGTPVSEEKMQIIMRILGMGLEDTNNLRKWIDFMDDLNREKK